MKPDQQAWWRRPSGIVLIVLGLVFFVLWLWRWGESGVFFEASRTRRPAASREGGTRWDWAYFWAVFPPIFRAVPVTVRATVSGFLIAVVFGFLLALGRRSKYRIVRWPVASFIEFIRSTPLLIQLFFIFFTMSTSVGLKLEALDAMAIALGIHYACYCSEAYRAGINSVPGGQWEASTALNFGRTTTWTRIILPQAIPNALPALGNYLVAGFKLAPIGHVIGVTEIIFAAKALSSQQSGVEVFMVVGIAFLMVSLPAAWLLRRLERSVAYQRTD